MLKELVLMLPFDVSSMAAYACLGGAIVGLALWLVGARFNQTMMALLAVTIGAVVGKEIPNWLGWASDGMALAVGLGVVLGVAGFAMHRSFAAFGLGLVAALWVFVGTWILRHGGQSWEWPVINEYTTISGYAGSTWNMMPMAVRQLAPFACLVGFGLACLPALIFARAGATMLWSMVGVSMFMALGLTALSPSARLSVQSVQLDGMLQVILLGAVVVVGMAVQWRLTPAQLFARGRARKPMAAAAEPKAEEDGGAKNVTVYINRAMTNKAAILATVASKSEVKPTAVAA